MIALEPRPLLLVEDNADDEKLALRALKLSGYKVAPLVARDGAEALHVLEGLPVSKLPALVLLDLKLPKLSGFEVLERLRKDEKTRDLPVVIMSSSDEQRDVEDCYRLGANSYIRKPVDFDGFSETVSQLGTYWLSVNVTPYSRSESKAGIS
ncbi:MAG TPA: response regulator [Fimbriimonadaceae bacterium]|nr:response regulator [Fimbriimonadaceae bacterium]